MTGTSGEGYLVGICRLGEGGVVTLLLQRWGAPGGAYKPGPHRPFPWNWDCPRGKPQPERCTPLLLGRLN